MKLRFQKLGKDPTMNFSDKIKYQREQNHLTQKELAERSGIRPPTISAICTGSIKHLPVEALDKICSVLECQPADLMEHIKEQ